jgi:hypothetical protein
MFVGSIKMIKLLLAPNIIWFECTNFFLQNSKNLNLLFASWAKVSMIQMCTAFKTSKPFKAQFNIDNGFFHSKNLYKEV